MQTSLNRCLLVLSCFLTVSAESLSKKQIYENGSKSRPEDLNLVSSTRSIIDLSGKWSYSNDDGASWNEVLVPSAMDVEGRLVYTRKFEVSAGLLSSHSFKFVAYGINYQAEVYLNEIFVGKHEGGYTSFSFLVPDNTLQVGNENVVRIVVDNTLNARSTLPLRQHVGGWKNYGGILRDVFLVATPIIWIDDVAVEMESFDAKLVKVATRAVISARDISKLTFTNHPGPAVMSYAVEVADKLTGTPVGKSLPVVFSPESNKDVTLQATLSLPTLKFWSPDQPGLYSIRATISSVDGKVITLVDEHKLETGWRTVATDRQTIFLNGAPTAIRGVAWVEDSPDHGSSLTYEQMEKDVALIKSLGANAVRFAFHPPHPFLLQLCDQYGLLAFEEIPLFEAPSDIVSTDNYRMLLENCTREMIRRDKNHPSVVAWGLGDGFESTDARVTATIGQLHGIVKAIDKRLSYYVSMSLDDSQTSSIVDIAGVRVSKSNVKDFKIALARWKRSHPSQPVLVGAYGKAIEIGNRNGYSDPMSQESQARYLFQHHDAIKESAIAGGVIWAFADWRGDRPMLTVKSDTPELYSYGIVEYSREKKVAYDVVRSMYLGEKISALPIGTHSVSSPVSYVLLGLFLLIVFAWFLNSNRRFRENVNRALLRPYNFFADIRDQRILSNFHTAALSAIVAVTFAIVVSSIAYHFRRSEVFDYALAHMITSDTVDAFMIELIWHPIECIAYCALACFAWMFVVTVLVQFFALFIRTKVYLFHSYSVAVWSTLPMIVFIPLGMILYRVMESDVYVIPVLVIFGAVMVWILFRTLKGVSIIYDISSPRIYALGILALVAAGAVWFGYFDYAHSTTAFIRFMISTVIPAAN